MSGITSYHRRGQAILLPKPSLTYRRIRYCVNAKPINKNLTYRSYCFHLGALFLSKQIKSNMIKDLEVVILEQVLDIAEWLYDGDDLIVIED